VNYFFSLSHKAKIVIFLAKKKRIFFVAPLAGNCFTPRSPSIALRPPRETSWRALLEIFFGTQKKKSSVISHQTSVESQKHALSEVEGSKARSAPCPMPHALCCWLLAVGF
jgi:hypothetical protein